MINERRTGQTAQYEVVVIGAGLSGVCAAIKLGQAGIKKVNIFEKASDVGGTWRDNRYPGVACDVPSHLYSYSFAPNPDWLWSAETGFNHSIWPGSSDEYRALLAELELRDFDVTQDQPVEHA